MIEELFSRFDGAFSENTLRAYRSDFQQYESWCATNNQSSLPATADLIADYVDFMAAENKSATMRRRINSLGTIFKLSKHPDPTKEPEVVLALKRMHRKIGRQQRQATPLTKDILDQLLEQCDDGIRGLRDQVLLRLGYETMRRRSEICGFTFDDLTAIPRKGLAIRLRKSKTDQEGASKLIPISQDLVDLMWRWKAHSNIEGAILRSVDRHGNVGPQLRPGSVCTILNQLLSKTSLLNHKTRLSGHSFRVGAAIDLVESGASLEKIMLRGGWRSNDSAMNYLRSW
jgi:site-specific recombinase XerD